MIKFCQNCYNNKITKFGCVCGYYWIWLDEVTTCRECGNTFKNIDFPSADLKVLSEISDEVSLVESMINLRNTDIIEYELKMSQFRIQAKQQELQEQQEQDSNVPKCPTCGSTRIKKVSAASKAGSVFMFGLLSQKVKKTWHCENCGYEW